MAPQTPSPGALPPTTLPRVVLLHTEKKRAWELSKYLTDGGLEVDIKEDIPTAVSSIEGADAIIVDITHIDDGAALCRELRTDPVARDIPLLALSEKIMDDTSLGEILSAGAMDVLTPPVSPPLLVARVGNLVKIHKEEVLFKESEQRYRRIFSSSHYGYFLSTREGRFLEINDALLSILGYSKKEEMLKLKLPDDLYVNPKDRELLQHLIEKQGFVKDFKVEFKRKDGSQVTILLTANIYKNLEGETVGYEGFNIPLTEVEVPVRNRILNVLLRPFRRFMTRKNNFMSVARISEMVANQYEKVEELSEGFYTSVWKGRDVLGFDEGPLVIKISKSEAINPRLLLEAQALRNLSGHPGVPDLVDVSRHRGRTVLIIRYVEGAPLSNKLPIDDHAAKDRIAYQLMDVVSHLHDHDIVHRDLKPDNIILRTDGTIVLLDYGIVKHMEEMETSPTIIGTRPYMSPEQINGYSERRSDVWGLGVVLYQLYIGRLPFFGNTEMELMEHILNRGPELPRSIVPELSAQMEGVLIRALRKRPEGRYYNAGEMRNEVMAIVPGFKENVKDLVRQPEEAALLVP
jgi:PAS domain S-box-containing protein